MAMYLYVEKEGEREIERQTHRQKGRHNEEWVRIRKERQRKRCK